MIPDNWVWAIKNKKKYINNFFVSSCNKKKQKKCIYDKYIFFTIFLEKKKIIKRKNGKLLASLFIKYSLRYLFKKSSSVRAQRISIGTNQNTENHMQPLRISDSQGLHLVLWIELVPMDIFKRCRWGLLDLFYVPGAKRKIPRPHIPTMVEDFYNYLTFIMYVDYNEMAFKVIFLDLIDT